MVSHAHHFETGEYIMPPSPEVDDESQMQYIESGYNHAIRKMIYDVYASPPIGRLEDGIPRGIDGIKIKAMGLVGDETIVDLGCGDGRFIELLATTGGHEGLLIGINNFANHYVGIQESLADKRNVAFLQGDIRHISLRDESADWATINNVLYHVNQPLRAFNEALRIVKPGGHLLIATRNSGNQGRMWGFMKEVTNELKAMSERGESQDYSALTPPETFYNRFDMNIARKVMIAKGLLIKNEYMQSTTEDSSRLYLPKETTGLPPADDQAAQEAEDAWHWYRAALLTLHTVFGGQIPDGRDLKEAIDRVVKPVFFSEIASRGFFEEQVEQGFIVAQKPV